ncbi:protein of unknown function [Paraburkholderia dioscoreae]|uniref:Uncharacterized protein n=1 Tax=Paraburkholderia dioscoreae TaxID=2604047 RepID=A0A5Q4ZK60_9BURK|nr:protein of unknown function [Paraburkholderia dioscoreae]
MPCRRFFKIAEKACFYRLSGDFGYRIAGERALRALQSRAAPAHSLSALNSSRILHTYI